MKKSMNVTLKKDTVDQLTKLGNISETYDDVICKLIKHVEKCDIFWNEIK